jgi:hypothetical protein
MRTWVSLDGTDGSGKSSLAAELTGAMPGYTVLERDQVCQRLPKSQTGIRLRQLRNAVFGYDHREPVWEYPTRYWLHALCSFFWLYHYEIIVAVDANVLTDGWATKHWARFLLHEDADLIREANEAFGALPWPHQVILLPRKLHRTTTRTTKPSERGAFDIGSAGFNQYQDRTMDAIGTVRDMLGDRVRFTVIADATAAAVLEAVT